MMGAREERKVRRAACDLRMSIVSGGARLVALQALLQVLVLLEAETQATAQLTPGIGILHDFINNDPQLLCHYVTCQEPVLASDCQRGTFYVEGVAQFACCGACVRFRQEGDQCTGAIDAKSGGDVPIVVGSDSVEDYNVVESSWCDHKYYCLSSKCQLNKQDNGCLKTQQEYDNAVSSGDILYYRDDYRWRPECTPENEYQEKQCKGPKGENGKKRCVCVDPLGNRIYGEAFPEQIELYQSMNCKCSRRVWELEQAGETTVTHHCQENGNYEPLQCEDGWCYCVDPDTAIPYGNSLPEAAMNLLHCYNKTVTGEQYLRRCESEHVAHVQLIEHMALKGANGPFKLLACDPDGSYSARQCDISRCNCYDKYYDQPPLSGSQDPGCQCARHTQLYTENNYPLQIQCKSNTGIYEPIQVQGDTAFCVDEDGFRSGPLVYENEKDKLDCSAATICQETGINCKNACPKCDNSSYPNYKL